MRLFVTGNYQVDEVVTTIPHGTTVAMTSQRLYWLTPAPSPSREV